MSDKTVLRAGYGIFYGGEENQGGNPNRGESVPFNQDTRLPSDTNLDQNPFIDTFSDGFPVDVFSLPAPISFRSVYPNWRNPLVHKWNFAVQRNIGWNMVWENFLHWVREEAVWSSTGTPTLRSMTSRRPASLTFHVARFRRLATLASPKHLLSVSAGTTLSPPRWRRDSPTDWTSSCPTPGAMPTPMLVLP